MVGCFVDIPIYVFGNFGAAESCGRLCGYNYVNDYVAKGILKSPIIYILQHATQLLVVWGVLFSKLIDPIDKLPITFNYRKYIYGCIADNTVALISHCCISATNTHNAN